MTTDLSWFGSFFSSAWGMLMVALLLGGSIFIHELGHFLAARWRGLKVDRFSIGFGPKIFGWRGRDGVEYRLSWIPLGGYVALPQLNEVRAIEGDPSVDPRDLPPVTYLDKMIVVVAGVVFNILFAVVLACVLWRIGVPMPASSDSQIIGYVVPTMEELRGEPPTHNPLVLSEREHHIPTANEVPSPAAKAGLQPGDRILEVDGTTVRTFRDVMPAIALSSGRDEQGAPRIAIKYERNGVTQTVDVFPSLVATNSRAGDAMRKIGIAPADKIQVKDMSKDSPAERAGMKVGDVITGFNGLPIYSFAQLMDVLNANGAKPATISVLRDQATQDLAIQPVLMPTTTPLATITVKDTTHPGTEHDARLDFLPVYPLDSKDDAASPTSTAENLMTWNVETGRENFGELRSGDYLDAVNGRKVNSVQEAVDALNATPAGHAATLSYQNVDEKVSATITLPQVFSAEVTPPDVFASIGITPNMDLEPEYIAPGQQIHDAFSQTFGMLGSIVNPHSDIGLQQLSGPIGISRILYRFSVDDVRLALWLTFIININLAIINLLPIPVLDGGHLLFFTIGWLRRRDLPIRFVSWAQGVFMILIMCLAVYVIINDSLRWAGDRADDREADQDRYYDLGKYDKFPAPDAIPPNSPAPANPAPAPANP
jgi:membrane-associated protease RseP (regulator of RpoE activity)